MSMYNPHGSLNDQLAAAYSYPSDSRNDNYRVRELMCKLSGAKEAAEHIVKLERERDHYLSQLQYQNTLACQSHNQSKPLTSTNKLLLLL